jgi:putative transposase
LLAYRGIEVNHEAIRKWLHVSLEIIGRFHRNTQWCLKFGQQYCGQLKKKRGTIGDIWFLDEVFIKINGQLHYLWRAVDKDGDELDILVHKRRNKKAVMKFFKKLLKGQQATSLKIITDKLRSYSAAKRELIPSFFHSTQQYENNRCEMSHQPTRQQERQMRRIKTQGQAQRFVVLPWHNK